MVYEGKKLGKWLSHQREARRKELHERAAFAAEVRERYEAAVLAVRAPAQRVIELHGSLAESD